MKSTWVTLLAALCLYVPHPAPAGNNSGQAFSIWPDTGQTTCYNAEGNVLNSCPSPGHLFFGEDAQYAGPARSYTKLDEAGNDLPESAPSWAMVRDNVTGLIWEAKEAKDDTLNYANLHDADNEYSWCDTDPDTNGGDQGTCGENNTKDFLAALNGLAFGGHKDWRVPTIKELVTLIDYGRYNPSIDTTYFPQTLSIYWSSTTTEHYAGTVWLGNFYIGGTGSSYKSNYYQVRAVRGGQIQPEDRFIVSTDGDTVTDTVTCLEWQRATNSMDWENALAYAENLFLGRHDDWRLPNINELRSIVDYSRSYAIDNTAFPDTMGEGYWSSTTSANYTNIAYAVHFAAGYDVLDHNKSYIYFMRAVRGGKCGIDHFPWPMFMPAVQSQRP